MIKTRTETTYKTPIPTPGATRVEPSVTSATTPAQARKASPKAKAKALKKDEVLERHFISSLAKDEASEPRMAAIIRSHWSCETRHWERDTQWREDQCLLRDPNPACALALIRTGLQALLRRTVKEPLPVIFENVADDLDVGLTWLKKRSFRL